MSEHKTSERFLAAHDRQLRALELRKKGRDYRYIATSLEYAGPSGAYQAVMTALKETLREPADEVRKLELDRLDAMLTAIWPLALAPDLKAQEQVLRLMDRRARYLGLDSPIRVDIEHDIRVLAAELGIDPDQAVAEAELILGRAAMRTGAPWRVGRSEGGRTRGVLLRPRGEVVRARPQEVSLTN